MDLTKLDYAQLKNLNNEIEKLLKIKEENFNQTKIGQMLDGISGQKLAERWGNVKNAIKKFPKKVNTKMLLQVELEADVSLDSYKFDNGDFGPELFEITVSGNILQTKGLDEERIKILNCGLQEILYNFEGEDDQINLFPKLKIELFEIAEELKSIQDVLHEHYLSIEDLDKFCSQRGNDATV